MHARKVYLAALIKVAETIRRFYFVERCLYGYPTINAICVVVLVVEGALTTAYVRVWVVMSLRYFSIFIFISTVNCLEGASRNDAQLELKKVDSIVGYKVVGCRCRTFSYFIASNRKRQRNVRRWLNIVIDKYFS
jgi:hypothetical protein